MAGEDRERGESSAVVMANIFGEYCTQVTLVDDQHAVGQFGSQDPVRCGSPLRTRYLQDSRSGSTAEPGNQDLKDRRAPSCWKHERQRCRCRSDKNLHKMT